MIDITQWRAVIGSFHHKQVSYDCFSNEIPSTPMIECTYESFSYYPPSWLVSICAGLTLLSVIFQLLLILSGDIETNPGPVICKSCPICDAQIHIRKQVCTCGYVFNQRHCKPDLHVVGCAKGVNVMVAGSIGEGIVLRENAEATRTIVKEVKMTSEESTEVIESGMNSTVVNRASQKGTETSQDSDEGAEANKIGKESTEASKIGEETNVAKEEIEEQGQTNIPATSTGVRESEEIKNCANTDMIKNYVDKGSLSQPSKWEERSARVNVKHRQLYKLNPMQKRLSNQQYYYSQPHVHSQRVLNSYHSASTPVKEAAKQRARAAYATNPSPIRRIARERRRDAYNTNPSPIRQKAREWARDAYATNPSPIRTKSRERARDAYATNPSPIRTTARERVRDAYATNPSPIRTTARERARDTYATNPSPIRTKARERV